MPGRHSYSEPAALVAEPTGKLDALVRRHVPAAEAWPTRWRVSDPREAAMQRRARRQALLLMVASSLASVVALYGAWRLLRSVI